MNARNIFPAGVLLACALLAAGCGREVPKAAALRPVLTEQSIFPQPSDPYCNLFG